MLLTIIIACTSPWLDSTRFLYFFWIGGRLNHSQEPVTRESWTKHALRLSLPNQTDCLSMIAAYCTVQVERQAPYALSLLQALRPSLHLSALPYFISALSCTYLITHP